jgi:hypothetical protein
MKTIIMSTNTIGNKYHDLDGKFADKPSESDIIIKVGKN